MLGSIAPESVRRTMENWYSLSMTVWSFAHAGRQVLHFLRSRSAQTGLRKTPAIHHPVRLPDGLPMKESLLRRGPLTDSRAALRLCPFRN